MIFHVAFCVEEACFYHYMILLFCNYSFGGNTERNCGNVAKKM